MSAPAHRSLDAERVFAVGVRTVHLAAVVVLGASLLGAPVALGVVAAVTVGSGLLLLGLDLAAGRVRLGEFAGAVVLAKLAAVAWIGFTAAGAALAVPAFWLLLVLSSLSAHLPKGVRHWRPGGVSAQAQRPGRPGRPE
jgi:hypothetical protein